MPTFVISNGCNGRDLVLHLDNYNDDYIIASTPDREPILIPVDLIIDYSEDTTASKENPFLRLYASYCGIEVQRETLFPVLMITLFAAMRFEGFPQYPNYEIILRYHAPNTLLMEVPTTGQQLALSGRDLQNRAETAYFGILEELNIYVS